MTVIDCVGAVVMASIKLAWNRDIQALAELVGRKIDHMAKALEAHGVDPLFDVVDVYKFARRDDPGGFNISPVIERALLLLDRDAIHIQHDDWYAFWERYQTYPTQPQIKLVALSERAESALPRIARHIPETGIRVTYRGELNQRLVIMFALIYVAEKL